MGGAYLSSTAHIDTVALSSIFEEAASLIGMDGSLLSATKVCRAHSFKAALNIFGLYKAAKEERCTVGMPETDSQFKAALFRSWIDFEKYSSTNAKRLFIKSVKHLVPRWNVDIPVPIVDPVTDTPVPFVDPVTDTPGSSNDSSVGEASLEAKCTLDMKPSQPVETLLHQQEIDESGRKSTELGEPCEVMGGASLSSTAHIDMDALSSIFEEAASVIGMDGSLLSAVKVYRAHSVKAALNIFGLYKAATEERCTVRMPETDNQFKLALFRSWIDFEKYSSTNAKKLFIDSVKHLVPRWKVDIPVPIVDPITDTPVTIVDPITDTPVTIVDPITDIPVSIMDPVTDTPVIIVDPVTDTPKSKMESATTDEVDSNCLEPCGFGSLYSYDAWTPLLARGRLPRSRSQHGCTIMGDDLYIFGGKNHVRYLNDLHVLNLRNFEWSRVVTKGIPEVSEPHSLIAWNNKLLSVVGLKEKISVFEFDTERHTWRCMETYGTPPTCRMGQSVTLVGEMLIIYGGEDSDQTCPQENLNMLNLKTLKWDNCVDICQDLALSPSPRSFHIAASYLNQYFYIFGGKDGSLCFNDVHILDLKERQWSRPDVQGEKQCSRARHSGVAIDQYWFVVGGQCDKNEVSGTSLFDMKTHRWSVINKGTSALACQGMTLVSSVYKEEYFLLSFGGFRNCYRNEITVLKSSLITNLKSSHGTDLKSSQAMLIKKQQSDKTGEQLLSEAALDAWMRFMWHLPLKLSVGSSNDSSGGDASVEAKCTLGLKPSEHVETLLRQQEIDESGKKSTELGEDYVSELRGGAEAPAEPDKKVEACPNREVETGLHEQELYEPGERNFERTKVQVKRMTKTSFHRCK